MEPTSVKFAKTSDGFSIAYTIIGKGRTLVHQPMNWNHVQLSWQPGSIMRQWFDPLAERFRLIQYDSRGQGLSTRGLGNDHSMEAYERDLEAVVDREHLERFVLFGHTIHAHAAVRFAAKHPDRLAALVLWECHVEISKLQVLLSQLSHQDWEAFLESAARTMWGAEDTTMAKNYFRESVTQADWLARLRVAEGSTIREVAPLVRTPTLLITSRESAYAISAEEGSRQLAELIPNARLVLFDDSYVGTLPRPDEAQPPALRAIEDFLAEVSPSETLARESGSLKNENAPVSGSPAEVTVGLSAREVEVLCLIATGRSNAQIAEVLVISRNTVRRHVSNIFDKLGAANRAEAASYATRYGIA